MNVPLSDHSRFAERIQMKNFKLTLVLWDFELVLDYSYGLKIEQNDLKFRSMNCKLPNQSGPNILQLC